MAAVTQVTESPVTCLLAMHGKEGGLSHGRRLSLPSTELLTSSLVVRSQGRLQETAEPRSCTWDFRGATVSMVTTSTYIWTVTKSS